MSATKTATVTVKMTHRRTGATLERQAAYVSDSGILAVIESNGWQVWHLPSSLIVPGGFRDRDRSHAWPGDFESYGRYRDLSAFRFKTGARAYMQALDRAGILPNLGTIPDEAFHALKAFICENEAR